MSDFMGELDPLIFLAQIPTFLLSRRKHIDEVAIFRGDFLQATLCRHGWRQGAYMDVLVACRGKKIAEE